MSVVRVQKHAVRDRPSVRNASSGRDVESADRWVVDWCEMAASLQGPEPERRVASTVGRSCQAAQ